MRTTKKSNGTVALTLIILFIGVATTFVFSKNEINWLIFVYVGIIVLAVLILLLQKKSIKMKL